MTTREDEMVGRIQLAHDYFEEHGLRFHAATVTALSSEREILRELLTEAQLLFALGVGAMTDNGDKANQERCVKEAGELNLRISAALTGVTGG